MLSCLELKRGKPVILLEHGLCKIPSPSFLIHHPATHWEPIISLEHKENYGKQLSETNNYNVIVVKKSYGESSNENRNSNIKTNSGNQNKKTKIQCVSSEKKHSMF